MTALYVTLVAIILVAFVGMFWLKRESDRAWRLHVLLRPIRADWIRFQISIRDELTPALRKMTAAMADMQPAFERAAEAIRKVGQR